MNPDATEELFRILDKHDVKYILIGGIAAVLHGSPYPTEDIDITPEVEKNNLTRLSDAWSTLHALINC